MNDFLLGIFAISMAIKTGPNNSPMVEQINEASYIQSGAQQEIGLVVGSVERYSKEKADLYVNDSCQKIATDAFIIIKAVEKKAITVRIPF